MGDDIPAIVYIRRNSDGEVREFKTDFFGEHIWEAGNYACDCNRGMFFADANNEDASDRSCGDTEYTVKIVAQDDGRELYSDDDWTA